jgi:hypothetical protein
MFYVYLAKIGFGLEFWHSTEVVPFMKLCGRNIATDELG